MSPSSSSSSIMNGINQQSSLWHSPIPYLFGGLAAMVGLIVFALIILAWSYKKSSSLLEHQEMNLEMAKEDSVKAVLPQVFDEKIVVIMAGDQMPSYLATPVCTCKSFPNNLLNKEIAFLEKSHKQSSETTSSHQEEDQESNL
ncbi:Glutamine dumper [Thalictrum thalictroides]|uniref:Glutamine dumper n=1 Tax=Thalictrum thalictroides TaxID=46969 RepID=A0A7J6VS56_THATH|nr:Glutamine dumper [Thalictrum thalictroides]